MLLPLVSFFLLALPTLALETAEIEAGHQAVDAPCGAGRRQLFGRGRGLRARSLGNCMGMPRVTVSANDEDFAESAPGLFRTGQSEQATVPAVDAPQDQQPPPQGRVSRLEADRGRMQEILGSHPESHSDERLPDEEDGELKCPVSASYTCE